MVSVAEAKRVDGLVPEDFKEFFTRYHEKEVGLAANEGVLESQELCEEVEGNRVIKMEAGCPWPIWNRVLISTFYMRLDQPNGEQIMLFSCQGNEEMKEKYFTAEDKKNFVLAT